MLEAVVAIGTGLLAGTYAGLLGVGGGVVMVPAMALLLSQSQHVAEGTSLLVIIPTAVMGTRALLREDLVERRAAARLAMGGTIGAVAGSLLALRVVTDEVILRRLFGAFLLLVAAQLLVTKRRPAPRAARQPSPRSTRRNQD